MAKWPRKASISSMTASITASLFRCALLPFLLPLRRDRRKPDYSGAVDDFPIGIEPRAVAWAVPGFLGVVPVHDAVEMRAHRRTLVDAPVFVAVNRDFAATSTDDGAFAGFQSGNIGRFALREIVLEL